MSTSNDDIDVQSYPSAILNWAIAWAQAEAQSGVPLDEAKLRVGRWLHQLAVQLGLEETAGK